MKALLYVEIDIDYCSLTYGNSPCEAALGVTGTKKCFNSTSTCQDPENFDDGGATLRFAKSADYLPTEISAIPNIKSIEFTPATLSLGEDLGQRATLRVTFYDHPHGDAGAGFDKYLQDRDYDPNKQGSFWGKFRVRHPYLQGRDIRVLSGLLGDAYEDLNVRHFIIESFDGPTPDGLYEIVAKDVLKLLDGDRAQAPALSNGFLAAGITSSATSASLSPAGIGNLEYPASGHLAIGGKEIVSFTRSGDTLTITRAQLGTTAKAHSAQDRVQHVLMYVSADPADIIYDLLVNHAGIDPSFITIADWYAETQTFLQTLYTGTIAEPTPVNKLVSELIQQGALIMWWDDSNRKIQLHVIRGILTDAALVTPDNYIEKSLSTKEQPEKRLSQIWTYYGQLNPLDRQDNQDNYRSAAATISAESQTNYGLPAIKKIFSRWIPALGRSVALRLNDILLGRFEIPPRRIGFELPRYGGLQPELGMGARVEAWTIQDDTGAQTYAPVQVTRLDVKPDKFSVEAEEMLFTSPPDLDRTIIIETDTNNFNFRTAHDLLYPTPVSGDEVFCIIETGVIVGSTSTANAAFVVGSWPSGVTLNLTIRGRIQGAGGAGGKGGGINGSGIIEPATDGSDGGPALSAAYAINVDGTGEIFGGGGGGGGGGFLEASPALSSGGGGGGGQGRVGGNGGSPGMSAFSAPGNPGNGGSANTPGSNGSGGAGAGNGGNGGGPGASGNAGQNSTYSGGAGGAGGAAILGDSFVTESGSLTVTGARTG